METPLLIYGANGYTGELIARRALARGLRPTLAGRNSTALAALAQRLGLPYVVVGLNDPVELERALSGHTVVLHCAGPFSATSAAMVAACLRTGVHYCDITGEFTVFEHIAGQNSSAIAANIMLMPGVGFDVVPSDCLAAHLKRRLPSATKLELAFRSPGRTSRGTATTILKAIDELGGYSVVRRAGHIEPITIGSLNRQVDFGRGPVNATAIPWGDISTGYHSTAIPNITVYIALPSVAQCILPLGGPLLNLISATPIRDVLQGFVRNMPPGPSNAERATGVSLLWGEASDDTGQRVTSRIQAIESYTLTAISAVLVAEKILAGEWRSGFQTPSRVYGPDLVMAIEGTQRIDL
ncbi:MAG: saccharopine dehydrogenase [Candidatus Viridilinea halotolerans]|uniref:Saccharopine dehydrogenase n=1 Tax=Candidatus Viridilinea halotolerans TaxID=2491704 RepID=A0A426TT74_9CHLR|nr:MAG: saccharopine dehydrogenase [Candidatus Viridilinea halotolerans]